MGRAIGDLKHAVNPVYLIHQIENRAELDEWIALNYEALLETELEGWCRSNTTPSSVMSSMPPCSTTKTAEDSEALANAPHLPLRRVA